MSFAKTGMNTVYCSPKKLSMLSRISTERTTLSLIANRNPCKKLCHADRFSVISSCGTIRIASSATITARKLRLFTKKHQPSPISLIANPAIAGPTTRAPLKIDELRAMALGRSGLPTIFTKNDCRIGTSNAFTIPCKKPTTITTQAPRRS